MASRLVGAAALAVVAAAASAGAAGAQATPGGLPAGWTPVRVGPSGGTVWQGRIPNAFAPWDRRLSAVYLPPGYSAAHAYPLVYLLHGMQGSPVGFWDGMRLADLADRMITGGAASPFIVVMPVAGPVRHPDSGE